MDRTELEAYITETYSTAGEQPWMDTNTVFRHSRNRK